MQTQLITRLLMKIKNVVNPIYLYTKIFHIQQSGFKEVYVLGLI